MADSLTEGSPAPDFELEATRDGTVQLADYRGKWVVLYFYPKDNTPGCTTEGQEFRDLYPQFQQLGAEILGISRDSMRSHENFAAKHEFPFPLVSDPNEEACTAFDVLKEKTNKQGQTVNSVVRSTFIIDPEGGLRYVGYGVGAKGHAAEILERLQELTDAG